MHRRLHTLFRRPTAPPTFELVPCLAAHLLQAGMEPWDVHMSDLLSGAVSLDAFQGIVFVGGFRWGPFILLPCF